MHEGGRPSRARWMRAQRHSTLFKLKSLSVFALDTSSGHQWADCDRHVELDCPGPAPGRRDDVHPRGGGCPAHQHAELHEEDERVRGPCSLSQGCHIE